MACTPEGRVSLLVPAVRGGKRPTGHLGIRLSGLLTNGCKAMTTNSEESKNVRPVWPLGVSLLLVAHAVIWMIDGVVG